MQREAFNAGWDAHSADVEALRAAVAALYEFAGTVAGGASWWDDVWPVHDAALSGKEGE